MGLPRYVCQWIPIIGAIGAEDFETGSVVLTDAQVSTVPLCRDWDCCRCSRLFDLPVGLVTGCNLSRGLVIEANEGSELGQAVGFAR